MRRLSSRALALAILPLALLACEVPDPPGSGGGIDDDGDTCGRGTLVISSDERYQSTSVAFVRWDGEVARPRVIHSGSTDTGLSEPLSGDVVAPTMASHAPGTTDEIVLVDRNLASVLTWIDVESGTPARQLSVRTGFGGNAQDYVAVSADKGYVTRYETNPTPGREPFDGGSDVLVIDPRTPAVVGRIGFEDALAEDEQDLVASPSRIVVDGGRAIVLLAVLERNFTPRADSRLAVIDTATDAVVAIHPLDGLRNCNALALAPGGGRVAVGCTGVIPLDGPAPLDGGGVAVVSIADGSITTRVDDDVLGGPPGYTLAFGSPEVLLVPSFGWKVLEDPDAGEDDTLNLVPLDGSPVTEVLRGDAFQLGEVRCAPGCGTCLVAGGDRGVLHRLTVDGATATVSGEVAIDDGIGLFPRYVGELPRQTP